MNALCPSVSRITSSSSPLSLPSFRDVQANDEEDVDVTHLRQLISWQPVSSLLARSGNALEHGIVQEELASTMHLTLGTPLQQC
jgi:hypothetical protein